MSDPDGLVLIATRVSKELDDKLLELARAGERSRAAELRLAAKAWVDRAEEPARLHAASLPVDDTDTADAA